MFILHSKAHKTIHLAAFEYSDTKYYVYFANSLLCIADMFVSDILQAGSRI